MESVIRIVEVGELRVEYECGRLEDERWNIEVEGGVWMLEVVGERRSMNVGSWSLEVGKGGLRVEGGI